MAIKEKFSKLKKYLSNDSIYHDYYKKDIDESLVYLESRDGNDFAGNILRIAEELSTGKYGNLKIYVYANEGTKPKIRQLMKNYNLNIDKVLSDEKSAVKALERAKYIITDSGLRLKYVKRPGQIVLNTWDGTPLKTMGIFNESEEHECARLQKVLFASDYLLFSNRYMKEKVLESYMFEKIYPGTMLYGGLPKNIAFFKDSLEESLGISDKKVYAWMPISDEINGHLSEIDSRLNDNQLLLVKPGSEKIDFENFRHIKEFPTGYDDYDILNIAECLITDYSNAIFDYANTKRKIILFNSKTDYPTFIEMSDLPFPKAETVGDLMDELNTAKDYDDEGFLNEFCSWDSPNAAEEICRHVFKNEKTCTEEQIENTKRNILIYSGGLKNNGMTSSLISVLSNIDPEQFNIFLCYASWDPFIQKNHREVFEKIPEGIEFLPLTMSLNMTLKENREFVNFLKNPDVELGDNAKRMLKREFRRSFSDFHFDSIIHFNGYGIEETMLFSISDSTRTIWVHNDMVRELSQKTNQNESVLKYAYKEYDNVAVVSPDLIKPTYEISGRKDNIRLIHNVNNIDKIREKSLMPIEFDPNTVVTCNNDKSLEDILNSPADKFITIGRFSPEKGHRRLIDAFNEYCKDYPDSQLIIIGGYGEEYENTIRHAGDSEFGQNITIINSISNPMPILKRCDLFVVSSFYEGWPMVIMEADALNVPVIATDITGTQWLKGYGGHIVENTQEGILEGMRDFHKGKVERIRIDYAEYNENAVEEFLKIIEW